MIRQQDARRVLIRKVHLFVALREILAALPQLKELASELPERKAESNGDLRYLAKSPAATGPHSIIVTATVSYLRPRQLFQFLPDSKQFAKH